MDVTGLLDSVFRGVKETPWEVDLPPGSGYVRLQTETETRGAGGKQVYRCFTNPIWLEERGPGQRRLRVTCAG